HYAVGRRPERLAPQDVADLWPALLAQPARADAIQGVDQVRDRKLRRIVQKEVNVIALRQLRPGLPYRQRPRALSLSGATAPARSGWRPGGTWSSRPPVRTSHRVRCSARGWYTAPRRQVASSKVLCD